MEIISRSFAFTLLIFLFPILIFVSILCMIFQGFPILFKQERVGYNYKIFKIYKFRTMLKNNGSLITKHNDGRITKIGKILRLTKIDEIPQLINILKVDMRFIGPRPEVLEFFDKQSFKFLNDIKPGISDYSSILFRNENKILEKIGGKDPYQELLPIKLKLADYYSENKNFFLDLKLVIITVISIIAPSYSSKVLIIPLLNQKIPETKSFIDRYLL